MFAREYEKRGGKWIDDPVVAPQAETALAAAIEPCGLVMSELVPGTRPLPQYFPQRNRVISGLCRAVVVVEAGERSGSLITARCALEQGRDVLAVPGNVLSGRNRGGHALLRDGAKIVETADDILEELNGIGYQATLKTVDNKKGVELTVGYANKILRIPPEGVTVEVPDPTTILVKGADKQKVGQYAAEIRASRKPEPYKGKGVRYENEVVRRKEGKSFTSGG